MGTAMDVVTPSPQHGSVDDYGEELRKLKAERVEILGDMKRPVSKVFTQLEAQKRSRLRNARDFRDIQLKNLYNQYHADMKQVTDEFTRGKRQLRSAMLGVAADGRQRLDSVMRHSTALASASGVPRRRRRAKPGIGIGSGIGIGGSPGISGGGGALGRGRTGAGKAAGSFIAALEHQGLVRVALTPDEVNVDLQRILKRLDDARANGPPASPGLDRRAASAADADVRSADKIHSAKGTLHYHDITCEIGDRVTISAGTRPKPTVKYSGCVLSVNPRELTIRADDDGTSSLALISFFFFSFSFSFSN